MFNPLPDKATKIWRYMDFTTFMALLNSGTLHLTRWDQFNDHFEGPVWEKSNREAQERYREALANKALLTPKQLADTLTSIWRKYRREYVFVNCWHISNQESAAFWKIYGQHKETVAVQTTYDRLRSVLPACYQIGEVRYVDHETYVKEEKDGFFPVMVKRKSFAYERELRVCYVDSYEFEQDVKNPREFFYTTHTRLVETVSVDLEALIEAVWIDPKTPDWFVKLVKDSVLRFGYNLPVCQSRPDDNPLS